MEMMTRIGINFVIIFISVVVLIKSLHRALKVNDLPERCSNKTLFIMKMITMWLIVLILMSFDWITHGRMFLFPVQIELVWSGIVITAIWIFNEMIKLTDDCPFQRPIGEILIETGKANKEDIEEALKIQSDERKKVLVQ